MCLTGYIVMAAATFVRIAFPEPAIPSSFGVNIHFTGEPRDLDLIAEAGFKLIRMDLTWSAVERKRRVYDFEGSGYDALTEGCLKRGIRPLYILDYSNGLYEPDRSVRSEEGRKAFASFAQAAARRYAGRRILWEIWNEPNLSHFWNPQPSLDDYVKLVEETAPRIREADPSGLILAPATSGIPLDWLEGCFRRGLLRWIDGLSVHPYRAQPPETVIGDYAALRGLIKRYAPKGKEIPIISGEWGYSLINWDRSRLSEEQQARYLVRMFLVNLMEGVPVSIWYDWRDDGTDPNEREHHFGTAGHDLKPKAAYIAAKTLLNLLEGYKAEERIKMDGEGDFALKLKRDDHLAVAFWTVGGDHEVILPIGAGKGVLFEMLGGGSALSWDERGLRTTISQNPRYLLIRDGGGE
ncbi:TPA: glycoside hydrolase family 5 [Candidatus Poribacteria bacterium]|nr:glycoside hydrolase family 5 [Candidatus Poribacteria bacterium]